MSHEVSPTSTVPASHNRLRQAISRAARVTLGGLRAPDASIDHGPAARAHVVAEPLEERRLLASISQGEVLEYNGTGDTPIRVTVAGDNTTTLVGASVDEFGTGRLNEISSTVTGPDGEREILGGFGGQRGVVPVGFQDIRNTTDTGTVFDAPRGALDIGGLAVSSNNVTYAVFDQILQVGDDEISQLYIGAVDRGTGEVILTDGGQGLGGGLFGASFRTRVLDAVDNQPGVGDAPGGNGFGIDSIPQIDVRGADFDPVDPTLLYFVATVTVLRNAPDGGDPAETEVPFLFEYDIDDDVLVTLPGDFGFGDSDSEVRIDGIAFGDEVRDDMGNIIADGSLAVFGSSTSTSTFGDQTQTETINGFTFIPRTNTNFFNADFLIEVATPESSPGLGGDDEPDLIEQVDSIEIIPGDPGFIFAVAGGQFIRIRTGLDGVPDAIFDNEVARSADFGPLESPDGAQGLPAVPGANIQDIAYNAGALNPFFQEGFDTDETNDGDRGAFFATDSGTDLLLNIDTRQRFSSNALYFVALTGEDDESVFTIAEFDPDDDQGPVVRQITPFDGNAGPFDAVNAVTGAPISVSPAGGTGNVFLGLTRPVGDLDNVPLQAIDRETLDIFVQPEVDLGGAPFINPGVYGTGTFGRIF
ncbi:MAG: hypothetical protein AAF743_12275, partial [Planctomycetota bacterium]